MSEERSIIEIKVGEGETLFDYCKRVGLTFEVMKHLDKMVGRKPEVDWLKYGLSRRQVVEDKKENLAQD